MNKILISTITALTLLTQMSYAEGYTMAPDGSYVAGDSYSMAPDGSYIGK